MKVLPFLYSFFFCIFNERHRIKEFAVWINQVSILFFTSYKSNKYKDQFISALLSLDKC